MMGRIIYCSDLVLRVDDDEHEISNITEWLSDSTDFRPLYPDSCVLRHELSAVGKVTVILVVWIALIVLALFYCYFCEMRLFRAKNKQEEAANNNEQNSEAHLQTIKRDFFGQSIPYKRMSKPPIPDVIQLDKSPSAKKRHFGDSISRSSSTTPLLQDDDAFEVRPTRRKLVAMARIKEHQL